MLYLNPPYLIVKGVSVFPDHADPLQWYYLPLQPRVSVRTGEDGREIPAFSLLWFRSGGDRTGGLLNFDVDLRVEDDLLRTVADEIQRSARLPGRPRLGPVPLEDGTVRLMLLGQDVTASAGAPARFVVNAVHPAKPSLYGDNRAIFSALLDHEGAVMIQRALDGELMPAGVVYSLDYLALRPAYAVRLTIDWDRVQDRLDTEFTGDQIFYSTQILQCVDSLVDSRAIVLESDTFVPEGADTKGIIARRDQALAEVRDMITDAFFTPSIDPSRPPRDDVGDVTAFLDSMHHNVVTGGGLFPSFTYNKTHYSRIDQKRLTVTMSERTTVRRTINPQAHLAGIGAAIRASGRPIGEFVMDVDTEHPWFQRRKVRVLSRVDFQRAHVVSVNAELRYGDRVKNVVLDARTDDSVVDWASVVDGDRMVLPVEATATVNLAQVENLRRPARLTLPPKVVEGEVWEVFTDDLFAMVTVQIRAEEVPWDRWSAVEVSIRHRVPEHDVEQAATIRLTSAVPAWDYPLYVPAGVPAAFDYHIRFAGNGRQDHEHDWTTTTVTELRIRDPFPAKRAVLVIAQVPWAEVAQVLVEMRYEDAANGVREERTLQLAGSSPTGTFGVDLRDPYLRRIDWRAIVLRADGSALVVGPSATTEPTLLVTPGMTPHQVVLVRAALGRQVRDAVVTFAPPGAETPLGELTFTPGGPPQELHFDGADPGYRYKTVVRYANGRIRATDWTGSRAPALALTFD
ncbi:hypothetical protein DQ384_19770 [Sphaerisporangium album]|uniref:Uncharacterized protein n=1 Tax=Sphaerisporangium album TaxID=509200 RepID=A0A367FHH2_9ACTN|nr:hypothetical protein [Sphaerisporangium album]RCG29806.1 hypothetical protein DQ384_19770 [Sphaerisporangium album]